MFYLGKKDSKIQMIFVLIFRREINYKRKEKREREKKVYKIILDARKRFYYYFIFAFPFLEGETSLQGF